MRRILLVLVVAAVMVATMVPASSAATGKAPFCEAPIGFEPNANARAACGSGGGEIGPPTQGECKACASSGAAHFTDKAPGECVIEPD